MTERPVYPLSRCCVPFCRRWSKRFETEWLCGEHWRLVDRGLKRFRTKRLKEIALLFEKIDGILKATDQEAQPDQAAGLKVRLWHTSRRWHRLERATWSKMKKQAIERAAA